MQVVHQLNLTEFVGASMTESWESCVQLDGIVPFRRFPPALKELKLVRLLHWEGIVPVQSASL